MIDKNELFEKGYTPGQINQIMKCKDFDLTVIPPECETEVFRKCIDVINSGKLSKGNVGHLLECIKTTGSVELLDYIDKIQSECFNRTIWLYKVRHEKVDTNTILKISGLGEAGDSVTKLAVICDIYTLTGKIPEKIVDYEQALLEQIRDKIKEYPDYPVDFFDSTWQSSEIVKALRKIEQYDFKNLEIYSLTSNFEIIDMMQYLASQSRDYKCLLDYNNHCIKSLGKIFEHRKDWFLELYDKNFDENKLRIIAVCTYYNKDYKFLFKKGHTQKAIKALAPFYTNGINTETIEYAFKNFKEYSKNDMDVFEKAIKMLHEIYGLPCDINFENFFNIGYSAIQRQSILDCYQVYNVDISKYCDSRYMPAQMKVIADAISHNKKIGTALDPTLTPSQMEMNIFYETEGIENKKLNNDEFITARNETYIDFSKKFHQIFTDKPGDMIKIHIIDMCLAHNECEKYQFDIDRCLKLSEYLTHTNMGLNYFGIILQLNEKSTPVFDATFENDKFALEVLSKIAKENGLEINSENLYYDGYGFEKSDKIWYYDERF